MKTKIGIVLSGGGARGIAFRNFKGIRRIWNCVSHFRNQRRSDNRCLYAAGYSIPEIVNILKKGRIFNFSNI
jgi:NTE family protein